MSRRAAAGRRRADTAAWAAVCGRVAGEDEPDEGQGPDEQLRAENARLREQLTEVEGWYRLLQQDHASLQANDRRTGERLTELQGEVNRLAVENQELNAVLATVGAAVPGDSAQGEDA